MPKKKTLERVIDYFGGRGTVLLTGVLCWAYFVVQFLPETKLIANILPPLPLWYFGGLAFVILIYQLITWRAFNLLDNWWFLNPAVLFMFLCELGTLLFAFTLLSWPIYFIYSFVAYLTELN